MPPTVELCLPKSTPGTLTSQTSTGATLELLFKVAVLIGILFA